MALAADKLRSIRDRVALAMQIANSQQVFAGSYGSILASGGRVDVYTAASGVIPLGGFFQNGRTGDTSLSPPTEVELSTDGGVLEGVSVTGVSAVTDQGALVYLSDDDVLTLTRPSVALPIGMVTRFITGTTSDVYLLGLGELLVLALSGGGKSILPLGTVSVSAVSGSGNVATSIEMMGHGRITNFYAMVSSGVIGPPGDMTFNLELGGTNLTGGVITINANTALGEKISGTAITAENEFHEGEFLDVEVAFTTAATEGLLSFFAEVEGLPGT